MRHHGRSYGSCRTWPAISRLSGRLRSWINKRRPRAIRRQRQRCRRRSGNYLLVSQESVRRAASRLPLVSPKGNAALRRSKTKTSYEGKTNATGGADRLPLVGPGTTAEFRLSNTQTHYEGKAVQSGGAHHGPVGRPRINTRVSALKRQQRNYGRKTIAIGQAQTASRWSAPEIKIQSERRP